MNRHIRLLLLIIFAMLLPSSVFTGCFALSDHDDRNRSSYEDGYEDGYIRGKEDNFSDAYDTGYYDGYKDKEKELSDDRYRSKDILEILGEAEWYARDNGGWTAYEAAQNIALYLDGDPDVTKQEYDESVLALYYFYEYFEQHEFE